MSEDSEDGKLLFCNFCGKSQHEVRKLIAGPSVYICDECVMLCVEIVEEELVDDTVEEQSINVEELEAALSSKFGQTQAISSLSRQFQNRHERLNNSLSEKSNILLSAAEGCRSYEIVKAFADVYSFKLHRVNAARLLGSGYFEKENILAALLRECDYDVDTAEQGIVFIDNLNILCARTAIDNTRRMAQENLLPILDGSTLEVAPPGGRKSPQQDLLVVDTSRILFVVCGDFGQLPVHTRRDHMIQLGLSPDFLDRFPVCVQFEPLRSDLLEQALLEDGGVLEEFQTILKQDRITLDLTSGAISLLAEYGVQKGGSLRTIRALMEEIVFSLPTQNLGEENKILKIDTNYVERLIENL